MPDPSTSSGHAPPTGTVTFLFTDIEGSVNLAQAHRAQWEEMRQRHDALLRNAIEARQGRIFKTAGDAVCAAFATAPDALAPALAAQRALHAATWGETPLRVRMGLHTGAADFRDGDYQGYLTLAHAQRVMSMAYGGQTLTSNAAAALLAGQLPDGISLRDMGEHRLKGLLNPERLWQAVAPDLPKDFPPLQSLNTVPNNLPIQVTSFVGRQRELGELQRLLTATRLLTLTGSGGTGKTRLSLQVAADVMDKYKDGVWFVELAPLADSALVPQTVAHVLGIREEPGRPVLTTLLDWLRERQLLLVLDNCEHLIQACAQLADAVLHAGPHVKIVTSSREALGIAGETAYRVPSLECPSPAQAAHDTVEHLSQYAAVQLFIERASQSLTTFTVTNANAPSVAHICYRLDGIPLAIELAAARVRSLSVEQIAARVDNSFQLLTGGSRTALPRQQTLRALIDWSYNLLSEPERLLLQRLSVFAGGWTLEAAEAVCSGDGIEPHEVLDLLLHLHDKSLIDMVEREGHSRYRMLETIRQYAREKLLTSGKTELVRDRHLQWFTQWVEETEPKLLSADRATAMAKIEEDLDNIRAASNWAIERQSELALRLVGAFTFYWALIIRGFSTEGRALSERALASFGVLPDTEGEDSSSPLRTGTDRAVRARAEAKTLLSAGALAFNDGNYRVAQSRLRAAEIRAREAADRKTLGQILNVQGLVRLYQGDHKGARSQFEQAVMLARHDNDVWAVAYNLSLLGDAVAIDDPDSARKEYEESLSLFRRIGDQYWVSFPLTSLAHLAFEQGDSAHGRALHEESLSIRRKQAGKYMLSISLNSLAEVMCSQQDYENAAPLCEEALSAGRANGNRSGIAWSLRNLAEVAAGRGDALLAKEHLRESLGLYRELDQKRDIVRVIEALAKVALTQEQPQHAARLWGAADALREAISVPRSPSVRNTYEKSIAEARTRLGDAAFEAAFAGGRALTMEQAIALALA